MIWQEFLLNTGRDFPFSRYNNLQRDITQMFSEASNYFRSQDYPQINAWMDNNGAIITSRLPGVEADNINISALKNTLTISGMRSVPAGNSKTYHRQEIEYGNFSRTIRLPFQVDTEKVNAKLHNGILHIALEKLKGEQPKKISINIL